MNEEYKGSTSHSLWFELVDSTTGLPKTGVTAAQVTADYTRTRSASVSITVSALTNLTDAFTSGGWKEKGGGVYRFDGPDAAFASGADEMVITLAATGCRTVSRGFKLVNWNKQVASIPNAAAGAVGSGLPILDGNGNVPANVLYYASSQVTGGYSNDLNGASANASTAAGNAASANTAATNAYNRLGAPAGASVSADIAANLAAIQNIQKNTFIGTNVPPILELPDAGSEAVALTVTFADETGAPADIDAAASPTVVLVNNAGTSRAGRLSAWTHAATGKYTATYTNTAGDALENLHWEFTGTVNGRLRRHVLTTQLVDTTAVDFTSTDRTNLGAVITHLTDLKGAGWATGESVHAIYGKTAGLTFTVANKVDANLLAYNGGAVSGTYADDLQDAANNVNAALTHLTDIKGLGWVTGESLHALRADYTTARAAKLDNLDATITSRQPSGSVTVGAMAAAALAQFFTADSTKTYAQAVAGSVVKEIAANAAGGTGSSLTPQQVRDAMKLAPTAGAPAAGSIDALISGAGGVAGAGADSCTLTVTDEDGPVADADVWVSSDADGALVVAGTKQTNSQGKVTFLLDAGVGYFLWCQKDGENPIRGQAFTAVAD